MTDEKTASGSEDHIRLLHYALSKLSTAPPRLISSPATQPRRAAVALILHIVPPPHYRLPSPEQYNPPTTLDALFAEDWVNAPGCSAELLYIRRGDGAVNPTAASVSAQQHVAFPGGRMDAGDEGERYTAMRTTWEELGIDLAEREWLFVGQMDDREITTSLGKRLLMILSPFVFIRTTPYPFQPTPPELNPDSATPIQPPTIYSIPITYLLSPSSPWSQVTIDISSRVAPVPRLKLFGASKRRQKRKTMPEEGSPEEAALVTASAATFWLWALRGTAKFFFRLFVGDMRFSALVLRGNQVPYYGENGAMVPPAEMDDGPLKLWGLTLGMTFDLLSGMQVVPYQPISSSASAPVYNQNILEHSVSSTQLAGISSDPSLGTRERSQSGSGTFTSDGQWVPSEPVPLPTKPLLRQLEELKELEGANVWTPSMTCVFPRFSVPDVNFWIWVFGKRYREVVRGWESSMRVGGSNDRRINWSGQALSAFYAAVRKALIVVIVARIVGILFGLGLWGYWWYTHW